MWVLGQQLWNGLVTGIGYSVFAMGLTLVFGMMGVINMAHGEFFMLGALLLWTLVVVVKLPFVVAMILGPIAVAVLGLIFNRVAIRPLLKQQPLSVMMSTMAVSIVFINVAILLWNTDTRVIPTPFDGRIHLGGLTLSRATLVLSVIGVATLAILNLVITRTPVGRVMRATAQDSVGAALIGINVRAVYGLTVAVSALLAAVAGEIIGPIWSAFPTMGSDILLKGFAVIIVGGMGSIRGCVIIGLALGMTEAMFGQYISSAYAGAYAFGLLIVMCLVRPQGLFANA
jgi:branched-chain amino acid transport system permease protein